MEQQIDVSLSLSPSPFLSLKSINLKRKILLIFNFFIDLERDREEEVGREKETPVCFPYSCIHWLILVCSLTRDWTHNLGLPGRLCNHLSYQARALKGGDICPGWCSSVDWALDYEPKGCQFSSQSGHMPGLQARSPVGGTQEATTHWCFSPLLSPSLPLSKNK